MHVQFTIGLLQSLAEIQGLGKNKDHPADFLVLCYYKAQAKRYIQALANDQVRVQTVDSAQGDEADFVVVDTTSPNHPLSLADPARTTLATTRSRGVTVHIFNRGTFVGQESGITEERASHLYSIFQEVIPCTTDTSGSALRIWCC